MHSMFSRVSAAPVGCRQAGWSGAGFSSAGNAFMQVLVLSVSRDCVILCLYTLVGHGNVMKPDTLTEPEPEEGAMGQEMREFKLGTVTRRESAGRHNEAC